MVTGSGAPCDGTSLRSDLAVPERYALPYQLSDVAGQRLCTIHVTVSAFERHVLPLCDGASRGVEKGCRTDADLLYIPLCLDVPRSHDRYLSGTFVFYRTVAGVAATCSTSHGSHSFDAALCVARNPL